MTVQRLYEQLRDLLIKGDYGDRKVTLMGCDCIGKWDGSWEWYREYTDEKETLLLGRKD